MFAREDLNDINFDDLNLYRYRGLYSTEYRQDAFEVPDGEENIWIHRAPKMLDDNGIRFWLAAELHDSHWHHNDNKKHYFKSWISDSDFAAITQFEFNEMVENSCRGLIVKPKLPLGDGTFVGAIAMCTMKRDFIVDLFAEFESGYLHFYWDTTA